MSQVMREVDQVKGVMSENINQAMSNLESTEALNEKTQEMKAQSNMFNKQAKTAKNQMWWENAKLNIITVRVAVAIVGFCNRHSHADHDGVNAFRFCGHPVSDSTRR